MPFSEALRAPCRACGAPARHACSRCRTARYCSAQCQRADWPSHRRAACSAPGAALAGRALLCALSVDLRRALPGREVEGPVGYVWLVCAAEADGARRCMDLSLRGMGATATCDAGAVCSVATTVLGSMAKAAAAAANAAGSRASASGTSAVDHLFPHARDTEVDASSVDVVMPLGAPQAAARAHAEVVALLEEIAAASPEGALPCMTLVEGVASFLQTKSAGRWRGHPAPHKPDQPKHREEAKHHTDTFVSGYDERCAYDPDALPVGAMLSALHFSQGLFFRRVDCVALADGFAPERLMGFVPVPSVVNLGALREAKRLKAEADADEAEENRAEADKAEAEAVPAGGAPAPAC